VTEFTVADELKEVVEVVPLIIVAELIDVTEGLLGDFFGGVGLME